MMCDKKRLIMTCGLAILLGMGTALRATEPRFFVAESPSNDRCDRALPVGEI